MSRIILDKSVIEDLITGSAYYVKQKHLLFDSITISESEVLFKKGKRKLALIKTPYFVKYNAGDTLTINFSGSMRIYLETP